MFRTSEEFATGLEELTKTFNEMAKTMRKANLIIINKHLFLAFDNTIYYDKKIPRKKKKKLQKNYILKKL